MIYPLLPVFLIKELGAGAAFLGIIEGVADATAAMTTLFSGVWADRLRDRAPLVIGGYSLASVARSAMTFAPTPLAVMGIRFADRLGKGIRSSPRDAIMADAVAPGRRGRAFGFHSAMDNAGAVGGPLVAAGLLACGITRLRTIFAYAAVPALAVAALVAWKVREPDPGRSHSGKAAWSFEPPPRNLRGFLGVLFLFGLSQSSDAFLLLRASSLGVAAPAIPLLWAAFNAVKIVSGLIFSEASDRLGRRPVIAAGWTIYALAYAGFAWASTPLHAWGLFLFYGLFYGLTEGPERALLADLAGRQGKGGAFGWFNFTSGVALLLASLIFGLVWQAAGASAAFGLGAAIAAAAAAAFLLIDLPRPA
jgi:MFS family permease